MAKPGQHDFFADIMRMYAYVGMLHSGVRRPVRDMARGFRERADVLVSSAVMRQPAQLLNIAVCVRGCGEAPSLGYGRPI